MDDWRIRLLAEQQQLEERQTKLEAFLDSAPFLALPKLQQDLLWAQRAVMAAYARLLQLRIDVG